MKRLFTGVLLAAVTTGCVHHRGGAPCAAAPGESACWTSSRVDADAGSGHRVVERVVPGDECDTIAIEQTSFAPGLVVRAHETSRCGVVERRIVDRYDMRTGTVTREVAVDLDHDDTMDVERTIASAMDPSEHALALRLAAATGGGQHVGSLASR